ncbi:MAG TPA: hypothetical protein VGZ02_10490 [Candidatus Baltobacteraceae bacterium]|jgi:F0F1-type ATP synthase membrane subunit b/b'|nr:hypothetical protein [Candidatus Baltobacteraceae bacterium]
MSRHDKIAPYVAAIADGLEQARRGLEDLRAFEAELEERIRQREVEAARGSEM